jgi:Ran GTPase-activating protein (RanGAP) involved in mRNA processing and transport
VNLNACSLHPGSLIQIIGALSHCNLKHLNLGDNNFSIKEDVDGETEPIMIDAGANFVIGLRNWRQLESLDIEGSLIAEKHALPLLEALAGCHHISHINLKANEFNNDSGIALLHYIESKTWPHIAAIKIGENPLCEDAELVKKLSVHEFIDMDENII